MALVATHRQVVHRLLPQTRSSWRRLERVLEKQRQFCNAALEERIDCHRKTGKGRTCFDQCKAMTECRRDIPEMAECPLRIQHGTLKRLDGASPKSLTGGHGRPSPRMEARTECTHSPLPRSAPNSSSQSRVGCRWSKPCTRVEAQST